MEAAISCKFRCKRLAELWRGYWPAADPAELAADLEARLSAATAAWSLERVEPLDGGVVALTCAAERNGRPVVLNEPARPPGRRPDGRRRRRLAFWSLTGAAVELLDQRDDGLVLTHLDLHAGNALRSSDGWKAIDPKGVRADRHADVWALTDPLTLEDFPHDREQAEATAARRLELYADAAEMDPAEARAWTRIRAGAEAEEVGDDSAWAGALRRVAGALD